MAMSKADSRRMYSWWWNSHISPKNSKWLQENLTDMDIKVKSMIKLIEEDADSFARRAEMYYKKRPELMKLVEEFYRAYRALAERYDHATGALRQAHRTMAEAFPNQVPLHPDDSPANSASDGDPRTPEMKTPGRALFDLDDLQKDDFELSSSHFPVGKRNGSLSEESASQKGLKQLNDLVGSKGMVRKGLNFNDSEEGNQKFRSQARGISEHGSMGMTDIEILSLKEALAKLEDEKEAGLKQYQESLERLSKLESEVSRAQEESRELADRASKAEAEARTSKDALQRLEAEREESLKLYHQCLEKISDLENTLSHAHDNINELNEQAKNNENVNQNLKQDITRLEDEKDDALDQYKKSLEMISDLEKKSRLAEEEARKFSEQALKAESEVELLKQAIAKLTEEKEAQALLYLQCLETISTLEHRLSCVQEEAKRLNTEIDNGVAKLKGVEEQCQMLERSNQTLHSELEAMVLKMGTQTQELTEKQKELGRLWTCIQEERLRFEEAETAFQTLQHLHSQAQEEIRSFALELQNRAQILRDLETRNGDLQEELQKHMEENGKLNELNLSSAISLKDMQTEILGLKESKLKLEEEVELRVDQRNALQQEIYCLKEELNELNKNHQAIMDQVARVGLNPECLGASVKELQDENSSLKGETQRERSEKVALLEKLEIMGQLLEKNAVLENSLLDLGAELEGVRGKMEALEESYQSLLEEKSALSGEKANLLGQLQVTAENLSRVSEKNTVLENSLFDVHVKLEVLKQKSKSLEDSCQLLADEKSALINEKSFLISQMEVAEKSLKNLELRYTDLEEKYSATEKDRESALREVEELHVSLAVQNQKHVAFAEAYEKQLDGLRSKIQVLQEESCNRTKEFEEELDKALGSEIEIFVLLRCVQDLEEKNLCLFSDCQKLQEASKLCERLIHELKQEKKESLVKLESLAGQNITLRMGMHQLLTVAGVDLNHTSEDGKDQACFDSIQSKIEGTNYALIGMEDKNRELVLEKLVLVTLLRQLKQAVDDLEAEKYSIHQESIARAEKILKLQNEAQKLQETNDELRSKVSEGDYKAEILRTQLESLHSEMSIVQGAYRSLQMENSVVLAENRSLAKNNLLMEEKVHILEEERSIMLDEVLYQSNLSLILEKYLDEKIVVVKGLGEDLQKLVGVNSVLLEKISLLEKKLEEVQTENLHLQEILQKSEHELQTVVSTRDQLHLELLNGKNLLHDKETQHMEAAQQLAILQNEKEELSNILSDLQREYNKVKMTSGEQGKQILKLSEDNDNLNREHMRLREASQVLELKIHQLCEEHEGFKNREEALCSELRKGKYEAELLETHTSAIYGDLQTSTFCQVLFEEKVRELTEVCLNLQKEITSKDVNNELLTERSSILERENGDLKAHLASYAAGLASLRDCILSLENHTSLRTNVEKSNEVAKGSESEHPGEDQNTVDTDALTNLQNLQTKVKAIETAVVEMERLTMQEKLDADAKLEVATRQIEELRHQRSTRRGNGRPPSTSEISEADAGIMTKDIMLDEASESSSYSRSKRELVEGEIWETADQHGSIDMNVENTRKVIKHIKTTSEISLEKEFTVVDKLDVSRRFREPREEGNKRKILERLNSDVLKLTNLQITVEDLRRKLEITENGRRGKAMVECETLKGQLEEAEAAIQKLFELNGKLAKSVEVNSSSSVPEKPTMELEESQSMRRKKITEQARRVSERIGRLQLEIQKIQFALLKLDAEKESKGKSRFLDTNRRVLLKDYLYGGGRTKATVSSIKRKKAHFCACVEPTTKGD